MIIWYITKDNEISSGKLEISFPNDTYLITPFFSDTPLLLVNRIYSSKDEARKHINEQKGD